MNRIVCGVSGMQNKECKTKIKNALEKLKGVGEVGVNLAEGVVSVDYNEPATDVLIKSCIEEAGFPIVYE